MHATNLLAVAVPTNPSHPMTSSTSFKIWTCEILVVKQQPTNVCTIHAYMYDVCKPRTVQPCSTYWDAVLHEDGGGEDGDQMVHEVGVAFKELRGLVLHRGLQ